MTSKSLFFKLLRENVKRRAWAIALAVLGFFFSLPINLALTMENAIKTKFWRYNDYEQLIFAEGISEAEKLAKILEIKTQIVLDSVKFGNGLIAFLIIVAAVDVYKRQVMRQAVKSLFAADMADRNLTPIIASHNLRELEDICDHVGLLHKGGILLSRELDDMKLNIHKLQCVLQPVSYTHL